MRTRSRLDPESRDLGWQQRLKSVSYVECWSGSTLTGLPIVHLNEANDNDNNNNEEDEDEDEEREHTD